MVFRTFSYFEVLLIVRVCSCFFLHVSYFMHRFGMYVFFLFWGGGRSRWPSVSSQICVFSLKMSGFQKTCVFHVFFMFFSSCFIFFHLVFRCVHCVGGRGFPDHLRFPRKYEYFPEKHGFSRTFSF